MNALDSVNLDAWITVAPTAASENTVRSSEKDFASMLDKRSAKQADNDEVREAADQLVATAFILPMLEQARNDPFKSDLLHGGKGEEIFGQQLDVIFADNITRSANFGISDALLRRFQTPGYQSPPAQVNLRG